MSRIPFAELPDHARLWVFPADRPLTPPEQDRLTASVEESLAAWSAHGSPVHWGHQLLHQQFFLIGVDETQTALTGCSIDACVHEIQSLERSLGIGFLDHARIFFRESSGPAWVPRPEFRDRVAAGEVDLDTVVFNNILTTVGEFRDGRWEVPARESWHARAFPFAS